MAALLQVEDLRVSFDSAAGRREVLHGVSFGLESGDALGIVGESGSGKSVSLRSIIRLLPKRAEVSGSVCFDGQEVLSMSSRQLRQYRTGDVAMMFQDPRAHINPVRTIGSFLTELLVLERGVSAKDAESRAVRILGEVGVSSAARRMRQRPSELSGGLLQRVMIAAALLAQPRIILADEISTALDVTTQEEVMAILDEERRQRGLAMVFVTHDLDLAAAVCDRLLVMKDGNVVESLVPGAAMTANDPYTIALMEARSWFESTATQEFPLAVDHG
ncbi:ABC transporter ATP-binding protein [Branchiibius cervicis]|uniref:ABC transporter ATP-binding protein n=1 Tax=Branchiibius cervicis TaxID=908252 RepID=A0ABW2ATC9_9MICO